MIDSELWKSDVQGVLEFHRLPADERYVVFTPRSAPTTRLSLRTSRFQAGADDGAIDLDDLAFEPGLRLAERLVSQDLSPPLPEFKIVQGRWCTAALSTCQILEIRCLFSVTL